MNWDMDYALDCLSPILEAFLRYTVLVTRSWRRSSPLLSAWSSP